MLDDAAARSAATQLNLQVIGTGGFLAIASRRGLVDSLTDALHSVQQSGLWLSPNLIELLVEKENRR
jgi:predicted nucleic acid-binding protein